MKKVSTAVKPTPGWQLWKAATHEFRTHWKLYVLCVALVSLPTRLLQLSATLSTDGSVTAYVTIASIIMNLALLTAVRRYADDQPVTLRLAYYDGTAYLVRFIIVSLVIALCLLPALLGFFIYALGSAQGAAVGEVLVVAALGLVVAIPSVWLLVRFVLGMVISATEDIRPVTSLKRSRNLTLGRFWPVLGRLIILLLWLLLIGAVITLLTDFLGLLIHGALIDGIYQFILSIIVLPLGVIYLTALHDNLRDTSTR